LFLVHSFLLRESRARAAPRSVRLEFSGFSDKLPDYVTTVAAKIASFIPKVCAPRPARLARVSGRCDESRLPLSYSNMSFS